MGLSSCACDVSCVSVRLQAGELADVRGGTATHIDESGPPAAARCTARDGVARLHVQPSCADAAHACSDIYSLYREERGRARRGALRFGGGEQTDETRHERELRGLAPKIDNKTMCWLENKQLSAAPASRRLGRAGLEAPPLRGQKILSF